MSTIFYVLILSSDRSNLGYWGAGSQMSFRRAARAAWADQTNYSRILVAVVRVLAGFCLSCGNTHRSSPLPGPNHSAYITLPSDGSVGQLFINGATGVITLGSKTPSTEGTSPNGLALLPSKKFLYAVNSRANTISIFSVASDGTLALSGTPIQAGDGPDAAIIDSSGKYLLVTNTFSNNVSVFSIDADRGALAEVAGSPFFANASPTEIVITHSGNFVYVANPGIGMVTGFSFSNGVLTQLPSSPVISGAGAAALAVDGSDRFLYVANPSAINPPPNADVIGNISGFNIDSGTGALTLILGSPFAPTEGTAGPTAITVDPSGRFVYAVSPESSGAIWCFMITSTNGQLVSVTNSPFGLAGGGLFALIDPLGNFLYIGSQSAGGIQGYTYDSSTGTPTIISGSPFTTGPPGKMVLSE
jgi:6-phosphogluconolactonase (cycloisomerase 2 family)